VVSAGWVFGSGFMRRNVTHCDAMLGVTCASHVIRPSHVTAKPHSYISLRLVFCLAVCARALGDLF
jgi:hypothetical protein